MRCLIKFHEKTVPGNTKRQEKNTRGIPKYNSILLVIYSDLFGRT